MKLVLLTEQEYMSDFHLPPEDWIFDKHYNIYQNKSNFVRTGKYLNRDNKTIRDDK